MAKVSLLALVKNVSATVNVSMAIDPPVSDWVTVPESKVPATSTLPALFSKLTDGLAAVNVATRSVIVSPMN